MAATTNLGVYGGEVLAARHRPTRLTYRLGKRNEIVDAVRRRVEFPLVPNEVPAARCGQTAGVLLAEVVRMRFGERGERADDRG